MCSGLNHVDSGTALSSHMRPYSSNYYIFNHQYQEHELTFIDLNFFIHRLHISRSCSANNFSQELKDQMFELKFPPLAQERCFMLSYVYIQARESNTEFF